MLLLVAAALFVALPSNGRAERGYIITTPNTFIPGRPEKVCVDLIDVSSDVTVEFTLTLLKINSSWAPLEPGATNKTIDHTTLRITPPDRSKCTVLKVDNRPAGNYYNDKYLIGAQGYETLNRDHGWQFADSKQVSVSGWLSPRVIFIQTDKPIYKPGQLVQFRIMIFDSTLRPTNDKISSVIIETPSQARVEQWTDISPKAGLTQLTYQLVTEPELGTWTIKLKIGEDQQEQTFTVEEYVLPKYEVTITPPKYITFQTEVVPVEICAKYTYGEPVKGTVEGSVCVMENRFVWFSDRFSRPSLGNETNYCSAIQVPITNGCVKVDVKKRDVGWDRYTEFMWGVNLVISAQVKEQGTGVYLNATSVSLTFEQFDIKLDAQGPDKFKPGLPYNAKVIVKKLDDSAAPNKLIEISIENWSAGTRFAKNYSSDSQGQVFFTIPPIIDDKSSMSIQARAVEYSGKFWSSSPSTSLYVQGWYSPSGSFLQFMPATGKYKCGTEASFKLLYTTSLVQKTKLMYKIVGVGDIVLSTSQDVSLTLTTPISAPEADNSWDKTNITRWWWFYELPTSTNKTGNDSTAGLGTTSPAPTTTPGPTTTTEKLPAQVLATHRGSLVITVPITAALSPGAHIIAYYVRSDGEIVADNLDIEVEHCTDNSVKMNFSKQTALPGEAVNFSLKASPNSLCGYGVVDKSVFLKGGNNQLSLSSVIDRLSQYQLNAWGGVYEDQSERCEREHPTAVPPTSRTPEGDTIRFTQSSYWDIVFKDSSDGFLQGGVAVMSNLRLHVSPCVRRHYVFEAMRLSVGNFGGDAAAIRSTSAENGAKNAGVEKLQAVDVRTYFPETWLWDLVNTDEHGDALVKTNVPHTITQWVGNAVCASTQDGFGVAPETYLTAFQPFFVDMTIPYSVIRGEKAPISLTVSNYLAECLAVKLSLLPSQSYTVTGKQSSNLCVCGGDSQTTTFKMVMNKIGDINITINAITVSNDGTCPQTALMSSVIGLSDTVVKPIVVRPEGAPREYTQSDFVCLRSATGSSNSVNVSYSLPLPAADVLVPESERAYVQFVGDVMGSAMSNVDSLLQMPYGCGEQNIAAMAPNIFVLKYLEAIHKDLPAVKEKAIQNMKSGYQRQLLYADSNQAYSAFGPSSNETGSTWLTAFVVKCFGLSQKYIFVDGSQLNRSIQFFTDKQQPDGCFPKVGMVHSKYMQGGIGNNENSTAALTAFVVIAMLEAGVPSNNVNVTRALGCLDRGQYSDAYTSALVAYAFSLHNPSDPRTLDRFTKLQQLAKTDGGKKFWKATEQDTAVSAGSYWWFRPVSADIETTAYALLTLLKVTAAANKVKEALPVVQWLSKQRNAFGGFGSTQDTVIGIQALAEFAALIYSDGLDANVQVIGLPTGSSLAAFHISGDNSFVELRAKLPKVTDLQLRASGRGCFVFQANVRYNVRQTDSLSQPFVTTAQVLRQSGVKDPCTQRTLRICTRYTGEGGVSNMAIIEATMPSGWVPEPDSLKKLVKEGTAGVARYEIGKDNTVQLYFNELDRSNRCFSFNFEQQIIVSDLKPAIITTYDYYKTELRQETTYRIWACSPRVVGPLPPIYWLF